MVDGEEALMNPLSKSNFVILGTLKTTKKKTENIMKQSKILYSSLFSNLLISGYFPLKYVTVGDIFFLAENKFSCLLL